MKTFLLLISVCYTAAALQAATVTFATNTFLALRNHAVEIPVYIQSDDALYGIAADMVYDSQFLSAIDTDNNSTNGIQPLIDFTSIIPSPRLYSSALEDNVQGRLVWGITQNKPSDTGVTFPARTHLLTASLYTEQIGTNSLFFGFKKITDTTGGVINATWDTANVYILTDLLPSPELGYLPPCSPGRTRALHWTPVQGADSYLALCAYDSALTRIAHTSPLITDTNYTFSSLIETTAYYYAVIATNTIGQQGISVTNTTMQDFNPPTNVTLTVNDGDTYTRNNILALKYYGEDITPMSVKATVNDGSEMAWQTYYYWNTYSCTTSWENGTKEITGIVRDAAGQTKNVNASIILDSIAPSNASIIINGGAGTTYLANVSLDLAAIDDNPMDMIIANNSDFSDGSWVDFTSQTNWTLPDNGPGIYTVYARFRDPVGGLSEIASDSIYFSTLPGADTNIVLTAPANNASVLPGNVVFQWNAGANVKTPQYLNITPGGTHVGVGQQATVTLSEGTYQWYVEADNDWDEISRSATRTLTVASGIIAPIAPQTIREHQILLLPLTVITDAMVVYDPADITGVHYLDTNRYVFSLIPDFGTAGEQWNVPFIATVGAAVETQTLAVTVNAPVKKVKDKKPLRFEDADEDIIDIKYSGIKKNNSTLVFDGQRLIISNAYEKGKLLFKVKQNKKAVSADGTFDLYELHIDGSSKKFKIDANVENMYAQDHTIKNVKIGGPTLSNMYVDYVKVLVVKNGTIIGNIIASNGFKKLMASDIINARIIVHSGDNMSIKVKNDIANSLIVVNGTAGSLAVKKIGTGGKGSIQDSTIIIGLPEGADYTNTPARAGFKLFKSKNVSNTEIVGSDYEKGKKGKTKEPKIKVKNPNNATFYHTQDGTVTPKPIE